MTVLKFRRFCRLLVLGVLVSSPMATLVFGIDSPPPGFVGDHPRFFSWLFAVVLAVGLLGQGYWFIRYVKINDQKHEDSDADRRDLRKSISHLSTQHEIIMQLGACRASNDVDIKNIVRQAVKEALDEAN